MIESEKGAEEARAAEQVASSAGASRLPAPLPRRPRSFNDLDHSSVLVTGVRRNQLHKLAASPLVYIERVNYFFFFCQ